MRAFNGNRRLIEIALWGVVLPLLLSACPTPTKTDVSIQADMPLAPGEAIVLFPSHPQDSRKLAGCLRTELTERGTPKAAVMDSVAFQDAMFPWFEFEQAPHTAQEMEHLLSRPKVRERIASLNVRYLIDFTVHTDADDFPGMFCGAGYGGAGCLGLAGGEKLSKLDAIVWDLKTGREAGDLSATSSGKSLALGIIIPIVFTAYTEEDACEALAGGLAKLLVGETGDKNPDQ